MESWSESPGPAPDKGVVAIESEPQSGGGEGLRYLRSEEAEKAEGRGRSSVVVRNWIRRNERRVTMGKGFGGHARVRGFGTGQG